MKELNLKAEPRSKQEKLRDLRKNKILPAVVYGKKQEPISLNLNYSDFLKTFRKSGESHIINLKLAKKDIEVLVHSIQKEPVTGDFIHIDFFALTKGEAVTTNIHLNFIGSSEASKEGAVIEEHMKEIEVKCLPKDLRDNFEVDLSLLKNIGDSIKVSELDIDLEKYEVSAPEDEIVVSASMPKKVEEEIPEKPEVEEDKDGKDGAKEEKSEEKSSE